MHLIFCDRQFDSPALKALGPSGMFPVAIAHPHRPRPAAAEIFHLSPALLH
ncbi:MAG: hypothetical protein ACFCBU_03955 [Cyanophyceae cyanobacterium]